MRDPATHMGGAVVVGWRRNMIVNVLRLEEPGPVTNDDNGTLSIE